MRYGKEREMEEMKNSRKVRRCVRKVFLKSRMVREVLGTSTRRNDIVRFIMLSL